MLINLIFFGLIFYLPYRIYRWWATRPRRRRLPKRKQ